MAIVRDIFRPIMRPIARAIVRPIIKIKPATSLVAKFTADSGLYTDTSLTVPVTSYGDAVAGWRGGSLVGVQPTLTARPAYGLMPVSGMPDTPILDYDLGDDVLPAAMTLPAITSGTIVIAGENGIWVDDFNHAGGSWSLGPTTYTGGPAGLLPSLIGNRVLGFAVFAGQLSPAELQVEVEYWMARGAPGVWNAGSELVTNGNFAGGMTGWTDESTGTGTATVSGGTAQLTGTDFANRGQLAQNISQSIGLYLASAECLQPGGSGFLFRQEQLAAPFGSTFSIGMPSAGVYKSIVQINAVMSHKTMFRAQGGSGALKEGDNMSLKQLTLNTDPYP